MNTPSLPRCLVAQLSVRLFAGLLGDRAAALGLNSRVRGLSHSRAGFENKRRVAAETWDRCGELSLPVIDRTAASHQALRASAKTSHRLKEHGRPAHWSCFDVGGTPTLLEFSARFRFSSLARAAALAAVLLAFAGTASAQLYWDNNGGTAGFGTAAGTWAAPTTNNSTQGWSTDATGATLPSGTTTTSTSDALNFGTGSAGLAAGTITVSGTVNANSLTFGSASGNITLSGGTITLGGTTPTITTNNTADTISSVLAGSAGMTKNGTGSLILTGANTYTGTTTINAGTLQIGTGTTGSIASSSIVNNGTLVINKNESMTLGSMTGTGNLTADLSNGFLRLGGNITLDGTVTINNTKGQTGGQAGIRQSQNTTIRASAITLNGSLGSAGNDSNYVLTLDTGSTNGTINLDIYNGMGGHTWGAASSVIANAGTGALNIVGSQAGKGGAWNANLTGALNIASTYTAGTLTLNATAASSITGSVTLSSAAANVWTVSPGVTMTASGVLAGSSAAITKNGTGTLILGGANTYTGATTINAGTLSVTGNTSSSAITINSGGNLTGTGTVGAVTLNTGGTIGAGTGTSTVGKLTGNTLAVGAGTNYAFTIGNVGASVAGTDYDQIALSGALTLNNTSANKFTVYLYGTPVGWSGANTYTWDIITAASQTGFTAGNFTTDFTNFGIASGLRGGNWTFTNPSTGTIRLTYAGVIGDSYWSGGTGNWDSGFSPAMAEGNNITYNGTGGGTSTNNISTSSLGAVGNITFSAGAGAYTLAANAGSAGASGGTALTVAGNIVNNSSNTQTINTALSIGSVRTVDTASGNIAIGGAISGIGGLTKNGSNTLTLSGANTYNGTTTVSAGTLTLTGASTGGGAVNVNGGTLNIQGNLTLGSSLFNVGNATAGVVNHSAGTVSITSGNGLVVGGIYGTQSATSSSNGTYNLSGGTLNITPGANRGITIGWSSDSRGTFNMSGGTLVNTGTLQIGQTTDVDTAGQLPVYSQTGGDATHGTLTMGGNGAYRVHTTTTTLSITGGNFTANNFTVLASGSSNTANILIGGNAIVTLPAFPTSRGSGATAYLTFDGGTLRPTASSSAYLGGLTSATIRSGGITFDTNSYDITVSQALLANATSTGGGLTKNGTGTLTLSGNNTYTGTTTINTGTLQIGGSGLLGGGNYTGNIVNNGRLVYGSSGTQILGGIISGNGALTHNGSGLLTLSGNNTFSGGTTITAGTVRIGSNSSLGTGAVVFNNPSIATIDSASGTTYTISNNITLTNGLSVAVAYGTGDLIFNGVISGAGSLYVNQTGGTITLNGLNTFTGDIYPSRAPTISFNSIANAGVASALGAGSTIYGAIGGIAAFLNYTGNVSASTNRTFVLGGSSGGRLQANNAALTWTGNVTGNSLNLFLQGTAGGGANYNELSGSFLNGAALVIQAGSGNDVWRISGNNTHTGLTQVTNTSTMIAANANAFGTTANGTQVDTSGQLLLTGGIAVGAEALTLNSNASGTWNGYTGAALRSISGNNSWAGNITLSQATTIATDSGSNFTISGGISGANNLTVNSTGNTTISGIIGTSTGTLTQNGAGTLLLTANNTYTGATTVNAGTLEISSTGLLGGGSYAGNIANSGTLLLGSNSNQTLSGVISGAGAITKNGTGTLTINNAASTYNGTLTINTGTLAASGNTSSSVVLNTGVRISVGTAAAVAKFNAGSLTIGAGTGYDLTIGNVSAMVPGTDYDQIALSGALSLNNTAASPFTIYLNGTPTGWSNTAVYSWDIISGTSLSGAFTAGNFTADFTNFGIAAGNRTGTWTFSNPSTGIIQLTYAGTTGNSTWNTGTGSWNTAAQWSENTPPVNFNNLIFNGTGGTATNNISNATLTTVNNITFDSGAGAYTLAANAGSAGASGGTALLVTGAITNNSTNAQILSTDLSFASTRTVNAASGNITLSGVVSGSGGLTKTGNNTLLLTGANTYTGITTINAGTLQIGNNSTGSIASPTVVNNANLVYRMSGGAITAPTTISGTGNLTMQAGTTIVIGSGNITQGGNVIISTGVAGGNGLRFDGISRTITAASINITGQIGELNASFGAQRFTLDTSAANGDIYLNVQNGSSGALYATAIWANAGTGNITIAGNNAATAAWGGSQGTNLTGALNISSSFSLATSLTLNSTGNSSITGNLTLASNSTNPWTVAANRTMTVSGILAGSNASITKNGTGTLTLSGNNTYTGTTTINAGTIEIGAAGRLGSGTYAQNITNNGTLIYSGTNAQTLSGVISGTGNLTQNASSTLTLSGANTYTGTTTVNAGTLSIGNTMTIGAITGSGNLSLGNGFTLTTNSTSNSTFSGVISGSGALTKNGASSLTLGGNNTYSGATTISAGTIEIGATGRLGGGNYSQNITNNGLLVYSGTNNQTLGGVISGTGALTHNASSTLTLAGNSNFNGATTINAGTLVLSGTNTASAITVASGGTLMGSGSGGATTVSGTIAPGNSPGTLTVGSLTLNGGGVYTWEMADATGAAGTGWDRIASTGLLTVNSTSGSTFTIAITSSGAPSNWNYQTSNQSWDIITYGSVSGFDATKFSINATAFGGTLGGAASTWALVNTGSALRLTYTFIGDATWAGGAADWSTGFSPAITNGANATFTGGGGTITNNIASATLGSLGALTFNSTAGAYTLNADSGSSGYDAASAFTLGGNIVNNSTATQTINLALTSSATRVYDAASGNLVIGGAIAGNGGLTKNGSNKLTLSGNNTYSGDTTINAGTLEISSTGLLGGGSYSGNIVNTGAFLIGSNSNQNLSGAISGNGALTKNGTGTLTLSGNNNYSGGTTLNAGTLVIGNTAAAGSGLILQTNNSSLLKVDVTGTINNAMSYYTIQASRNATLAGAQTVNNATFEVDDNTTLTITGNIGGTGGVTKNGNGTLLLNGTNTYNGSTVVNAGILNAASAGALGSNNTVQVTGGTLLVTVDDAINGKNIQMGGSGVGLQFSGTYSGVIGNLTLSANSIIDLGTGSVQILFQGLNSSNHTLSFYNWSGKTLWNGGNGTTDTDKVYFGPDLSDEALAKIYFYSGPGDSFLGSGFELMPQTTFEGTPGYQIIPVPEPETWATGILLMLGGGVWLWRKRKNFTTQSNLEGAAPSAPIEKMVGLFRRNDPNQPQSRLPALSAKSARICRNF